MTDAGLANLNGLTRIKHLDLNDTRVTDAGLVHVRDLAELVWLGLYGTYVTDAGLVHLKSLKWLKDLDLKRTNVTAAGVEGLETIASACRIIADPAALKRPLTKEPTPTPSRAKSKPALKPRIDWTSPTTKMEFVCIKGGEFMMGSPDGDMEAEKDEKPSHRVRISKPFYLGVCEVTQAQYEAVMGNNPS